jgi:hypothetical protein
VLCVWLSRLPWLEREADPKQNNLINRNSLSVLIIAQNVRLEKAVM